MTPSMCFGSWQRSIGGGVWKSITKSEKITFGGVKRQSTEVEDDQVNEKNSPTKLIEGGMGEFPIHIKNHMANAMGIIENIPLLIIILRDLEF